MKAEDSDRFYKDPPFIGSNRKDWEDFFRVTEECIKRVQTSTSPREMVLETWLLVDYCVRDLLLFAFDLKRFNLEDFDLRYEYLPRSFQECLRTLRAVYKAYQDIKPPKRPDLVVLMTPRFMRFFDDYDREAFDQFSKAQNAYIEKYYPDFKAQFDRSIFPDTRGYISESWLEVVRNLTEDWFTKAERLNMVRNIAAHTYNQEKIYSKLGLAGNQVTDLVRNECLSIIRELVGVLPVTDGAK